MALALLVGQDSEGDQVIEFVVCLAIIGLMIKFRIWPFEDGKFW